MAAGFLAPCAGQRQYTSIRLCESQCPAATPPPLYAPCSLCRAPCPCLLAHPIPSVTDCERRAVLAAAAGAGRGRHPAHSTRSTAGGSGSEGGRWAAPPDRGAGAARRGPERAGSRAGAPCAHETEAQACILNVRRQARFSPWPARTSSHYFRATNEGCIHAISVQAHLRKCWAPEFSGTINGQQLNLAGLCAHWAALQVGLAAVL